MKSGESRIVKTVERVSKPSSSMTHFTISASLSGTYYDTI
jgi:hypothetical protein